MRKEDATSKSFFRSQDRVFQANGSWWFGGRGPYRSRQIAQDELRKFILNVRGDIEPNQKSILEKGSDAGSAWDSRPDVIR
jgi:hypothetical protein